MVKKAPNGSDISKLADGYASNRDRDNNQDQQETDRSPIVSFRDCLNKLERELDAEGYQLIASPTGRFCGYDVYVKSHLEIEGLSQPKSFAYYRQIRVKEKADDRDNAWAVIAQTQFLSKLRAICEENRLEASKKEASRWEQLAMCFDDQMADGKSPVAKIAQSSIGLRSTVTTLTGRSGFHKVVPPLEWFPKHIQDYDPEDLLTLFPPAEKAQLVLILGRVMAGASGNNTAEGKILHTARSYGLIVSKVGGMGKSTLLNYIKDAIESLGYITAQINSDLNKFGWGAVATADLATIDDLTDDKQKTLVQHVMVKSIVSNGYVKVEEKGMAAVDVRATSTILACTNNTNYKDYIGMDGGSLSRLNQLDTYTIEELAKTYPNSLDARILPYWEAKAKELGCTTRLLAARLLRHCLDQFLGVTGYTFNEQGYLAKDLASDALELVTKANRDLFRIDVSLRHSEELPKAIAHLVALTIARANEHDRKRLFDNLQFVDFNPEIVLLMMELFAYSPRLPEPLSELQLHHASYDSRNYIRAKLQTLRTLKADKSVEDTFSKLISELKSNKGFGYPSRTSHYQSDWIMLKRQIPGFVESYIAKSEAIGSLPAPVKSATNQLEIILTQITE